MTETIFKKGDTVEVDNIYGHTHDNRVGAKGTITEVRGGGTAYYVRVENKENYRFGQTLVFYPNELKLVKPEPKFQVGDEVTFVMLEFAPWQGGRGVIERGPTTHLGEEDGYFVEVTEVPPANSSIKVGHKAWLYARWLKAAAPKTEAVKPLKIYLAGPMSGIEHYNFPAFFTAARELRKAGHTVFNPAENDLATGFNALGMEGHEAADHGFSLRDALKTDLSWICENAEALVLLDGWEGSKGVRAEMALAEALGLPKYEMAKLPVEVAK